MNGKSTQKKVAILIPAYNGEQYIDKLFKSICRDTYPKENLGIFVVDNASSDQTVARITNYELPMTKVTVIQNKTNLYFAKAINQAATAAMSAGYDELILLNQDTTVLPGWIDELLKVRAQKPEAAAIQSRLMKPDGSINCLGNAIHYLGFGFSVGNGKKYPISPPSRQAGNIQYPAFWSVTYPSGAAMMVSALDWKESGGLLELLEMYHEDQEWGQRMNLRGRTSYCARDSVVVHDYQFEQAPYKYYFMERNRLVVLLLYYHLWTLLLITPIFFVMELGMVAFSIKNGWWREKFRSYRDAIRMLPQTLRLRKKSLVLRKVSDRDILKRMEATIKDQPVNNVILDRIANPVLNAYYQFILLLL